MCAYSRSACVFGGAVGVAVAIGSHVTPSVRRCVWNQTSLLDTAGGGSVRCHRGFLMFPFNQSSSSWSGVKRPEGRRCSRGGS